MLVPAVIIVAPDGQIQRPETKRTGNILALVGGTNKDSSIPQL